MKILLVEDEVQMSEAIASLLKKNQCLVECAYDGDEGYRMGLVGDYDVIIMDIMLPVTDGYIVVKKLRNAGVTTPITIPQPTVATAMPIHCPGVIFSPVSRPPSRISTGTAVIIIEELTADVVCCPQKMKRLIPAIPIIPWQTMRRKSRRENANIFRPEIPPTASISAPAPENRISDSVTGSISPPSRISARPAR